MASQSQSGTDGAWKTFAKQLGKNAEKKPGWMYLLAATYVAIPMTGLPSTLPLRQWSLSVPNEMWATVIALLAYAVGDALDKITFKRLAVNSKGRAVWEARYVPVALKTAKKTAEAHLGIEAGIYDVSMKVLEAGHDARFSVHSINEIAKFLRSLIVPAALLAVWQFGHSLPVEWALPLSAGTVVGAVYLAVRVYPKLKTAHITSLYESVPGLVDEQDEKGHKKLEWFDAEGARLFFWEGKFVASAQRPANQPGRQSIN